MFSRLRSIWRALWKRSQQDHDLNDEMRFHIEARTEDLIRAGLPREEALRRARIEFGCLDKTKEECRESRRINWLEDLLQDVRFALRMIRKSPGFTAVAVLTLALGIGANTAIFSLINAVMLKTLPVKDPQQLVLLKWDSSKWPPGFVQSGGDSDFSFSYPVFEEFREQDRVLSSIFAFASLGFGDQNSTVSLNGEPTLANGEMVTGGFFPGLGVSPLLGRAIVEADEQPGAPRVAVISYAYWTRRFSRDPSILGTSILLNNLPFTIVGVTRANFYGIQPGTEPDLYVALADLPNLGPWGSHSFTPPVYTTRNCICLNIMGRLRPQVTSHEVQATLDAVFRRSLAADWTPKNPEDIPHLSLASAGRGLNNLREASSQSLFILMVVVGAVLLIACANLATLLLARATGRQREIAVRLALGASRFRLVRQLLTESILLSSIGAALGLGFAYWGTQALIVMMSRSDSRIVLDVRPEPVVLLFTLVVAGIAGVLFGLIPAFRATAFDLSSTVKENASNFSGGYRGFLIGKSLVVVQIAVSLVLTIGAGLFVRTLQNLEHKDIGFNQKNLLLFGLNPAPNGYEGQRMIDFYTQLLERLQSMPGVSSATLYEFRPLSRSSSNTPITAEGSGRKADDSIVRWGTVGPEFFKIMQIPILLGRGIDASDTATSPKIAVVNEAFARHYFANEDPLGHRISFGDKIGTLLGMGTDSFEIVGVSKFAELTDLHGDPQQQAFFSFSQMPKLLQTMYFEIRASGNPGALVSEVRDAVRQSDSNLPLLNLRTQIEQTEELLTDERLFARLSSFFGLLALLLASVGLYGTMAYHVTRKTHEIGIRMALGAQPSSVMRLIVSQGLRLVFIGVAMGIAAAFAVTRFIASQLYGVKPTDIVTFAGVAALLTLIALAACCIPARRAMRVDPMVALRHE
jgi:predicted permease